MTKSGREGKSVSRCRREPLFFACAKKSNQKKSHPGGTPSAPCATGPQAGREFSEGTSMCPPKTLRIVRSAPAGFYPSRLPCPGGPMKNKRASGLQCGIAWKAIVLDLAFNPVEARQAGGANTRRAACTMRASILLKCPGRHRDVPSGNAPPACASVTRSGTDGPTGWPSLVTFLATQESDPRKARNALDPGETSIKEANPTLDSGYPNKRALNRHAA